MSTPGTRLQATVDSSGRTVTFAALFAAPLDDDLGEAACGEGRLATGDGQEVALGCLCPPSAVTWREQRRIELCTHTYRGAGPFTAELSVDDQVVASAVVTLSVPEPRPRAVEPPPVPLFALAPVPDAPYQRRLTVQAPTLSDGQRLRLDAGAGQVREFAGEDGQAVSAEVLLSYPKPGVYVVTLDLLDTDGFWIETLAQSPLEIAADGGPKEAAEPRALPPWAETEPLATRRVVDWLPYRNIRPVAGGTRTYSQAGGGTVRRWVGSGTWMSVRRETTVGGALWYQTAGGDWIKASTVSFFAPSELQGVLLDDAAPTPPPPPPPPPPSSDERRGIVTSTALNVRARPGTSPGNPPVDVLHAGAQVTILEEQRVGSEAWYRIAEARWICGTYVRLVSSTPPPAGTDRTGVVTASVLNVRGRPGAAGTNPPIGSLRAGNVVTIYEEQSVAGELWYRVGANRWVAARWVRLNETRTRAPALDAAAARSLPFGWVVPETLAIRGLPGGPSGNPNVGQLHHYDVVPILEERVTGGARWYCIGDRQWVEAAQVGVARKRVRPASISAGALWVAVNLSQQTVVAYEGDRPMYAALAATGLPGTPTVQGIFRTWLRLDTGKMRGPGYDIEDVTWTSYFYSGYSLHTAYWHDKFGRPRSHGCVNLSPYDAWWIYQWSAKGGANSPTVYVYWA